MILFQRLFLMAYYGVLFGLLLLGLARVLFSDDTSLQRRLVDYLKALVPFVLWPLAIFVPRSQRMIKDALPFRRLRRMQ
jgi:hypothetical protein